MKIYLIRHGETDWNVKRLLQGRTDIPLNQKGLDLANITAKGLKDVPFDIIFTSPLQRAKETALAIADGRDVEVVEDARLIEISFGGYEGTSCDKKTAGNVPDGLLDFFINPHLYTPLEDGESVKELCDRAEDFLKWLIAKPEYQNSTVLLSTHGATLMGLLNGVRRINKSMQGDTSPEDLSIFWGEGVHRNCAVTILEADEKGIHIVEENKIFYDPNLSENYFDRK